MNPLASKAIRFAGRRMLPATLAGLVWLASAPVQAGTAPPARVVSLNVCTDQLAMLVAEPGQLVAVSQLAREPQSSALAEAAMAYPTTGGGAEDVFRLKPDLVLAGAYTTPVTVRLLQRLGVRLERFDAASDLAAIAADLRRMGRLLGRQARAERLAAAVERRLGALAETAPVASPPIRSVFFDANSYTAGTGTLMHAVIEAAGLRNIAAERGLSQTARLPLELLALSHPQLLLLPERYGRPSMGEAVLDHPAVRALVAGNLRVAVSGAASTCATPATVAAVERLAAVRHALAAKRPGHD